MTDFRALCAELVASLDGDCLPEIQDKYYSSTAMDAIDRARAALAQPAPPSLKEQALEELSLISISPESGVRVSALDTIRRALEQLDD